MPVHPQKKSKPDQFRCHHPNNMSESDNSSAKKNRHQHNGLPLDGVQFPNESTPLGNDHVNKPLKIDVPLRARVVPIPPKPPEQPPKK